MNGIPEGTDGPAANLLQSSLLAAVAGALGGALAAIVILGVQRAQGMIWGAAINKGLPPGDSPVLTLGLTTGIGLILALIQRHRSPALLPEINDTLLSLRGPSPRANGARAANCWGGCWPCSGEAASDRRPWSPTWW